MNENGQNEGKKVTETIVRPFEVNLDDAARINLETSPILDAVPPRQDKAVTVQSADMEKRTSSILLGYNVDSNGNTIIQLADGSYVSVDDFVVAVQESLSRVDERATVVSKTTGKQLTSEELDKLVEVCAKAGKITLQESRSITNQTAKSVEVLGKNAEEAKKSGSMMLGNDGFQLPNGDYVSLEELETAIADFQVIEEMKQAPPPIRANDDLLVEPIPEYVPDLVAIPDLLTVEEYAEDPNKRRKVVVTPLPVGRVPLKVDMYYEGPKKIAKREKMAKKLLPLILVPIVLLGFGKKEEKIVAQNPALSAIVQQINDNPEDNVTITPQMILDAMDAIAIGDKLETPEGVQVHESSDYEYGGANATGTIGDKWIPAGTYAINYISVINPANGDIVRVESEQGESLLETLQKASEQTGVAIEDLEGKLHIDDPTAGWIDVNLDLIRANDITEEAIDGAVLQTQVYYAIDESGQQVHDGKFTTVDGGVLTSETHSDLSEASKGDTLVDSEGKKYAITDINVNDEKTEKTETHINWSFKNIPKNLEALATVVQQQATEVSTYVQTKASTNGMGGSSK